MKSKKRGSSAAVLQLLIDELDGVYSTLPSAYYEVSDDEEDGEDVIEAGQIDSEEIEVALSGVVTSVSTRCKLKREPTSLSELLEVLLSPDDELVSIAENLEEAINGYFGELFGESLELANEYLRDLIDGLKERKEK